MKNTKNIRFTVLWIGLVMMLFLIPQFSWSQQAKKNRVRLNADYVKVMGAESYLNIKASARINKQTIQVSGIKLDVYYETQEEEIILGEIMTNSNGEGKFIIENFNELVADSTGTYNLGISFAGNEEFKKASKGVSFKNASIKTSISTKDSINYISAHLIDTKKDSPVVGESLGVQVKRLFRPLRIGDEFNITDEEGSIEVVVEHGIPGIDGMLTLEVVLSESDDYGTIIAPIDAPVGVAFVDESTFDQRTMWSPRNKTPLFLLIFPNLLIFAIWGFIVYLVYNLFRIIKS